MRIAYLFQRSAFEIAIKTRNGKLELTVDVGIWFEKALCNHGLQELPITGSIRSVTLPPLHNDPCDRFIIATALQNSMAIVTCDSLIAQYREVKVIW